MSAEMVGLADRLRAEADRGVSEDMGYEHYVTHYVHGQRTRALLNEAATALAARLPDDESSVDWKALYQFQTAMRYMDNNASLSKQRAEAMACADIAQIERSAAAPTGGQHG